MRLSAAAVQLRCSAAPMCRLVGAGCGAARQPHLRQRTGGSENASIARMHPVLSCRRGCAAVPYKVDILLPCAVCCFFSCKACHRKTRQTALLDAAFRMLQP